MADEPELDPLAWEAARIEIARVHAANRGLVPGDLVVVTSPTASLGTQGVVEKVSASDKVRLSLDGGRRTGTFPRSSLMWIGPRET